MFSASFPASNYLESSMAMTFLCLLIEGGEYLSSMDGPAFPAQVTLTEITTTES